jgi:hypothetical protein
MVVALAGSGEIGNRKKRKKKRGAGAPAVRLLVADDYG